MSRLCLQQYQISGTHVLNISILAFPDLTNAPVSDFKIFKEIMALSRFSNVHLLFSTPCLLPVDFVLLIYLRCIGFCQSSEILQNSTSSQSSPV